MKRRRINQHPLVEAIFSGAGISLAMSILHSWWWLIPLAFIAAFAIWCWRAQQPEPNPYICDCGYNNLDTKALRCPECGKAIAPATTESRDASL